MSNEYDYNQDRSEDNTGYNTADSTQRQQGGTYPQEDHTGGTYHYSGASIPGGGYEHDDYGEHGRAGQSQEGDTYPKANPMASYNVTPHREEKKSMGKGVIAIAIVCALVGGIGGGAAVGMALKGGSGGEQEPSEIMEAQQSASEPSEEDATAESPSAFNSTVIDVTTNSQETTMTPQDVYEHYVNAVVAISNESTTNVFGQEVETASSGSGFIISEDGYIVTNNHVVSGAQRLTVIMTNGEEYEAQIIGADSENDVALLKIDATDLPTVSVGDSDAIEVGQQVCAIGNPLGELTNTMTVGYVSALDREINENGTPINMFQTDCAINSGNSGGPIFDMHGNVIGITTAKYSSNSSLSSSTASIEGIGFCVPINDAMDIVSDLLQYGYVKGRPSLGITCQAISSTVTRYYNLPAGIYINSVEAGSAADQAGLMEGDIISAVDGTEVSSVTDFKALLKQYTAGDAATLTIYRGSTSETMEVDIIFDEKNSAAQTSTSEQSVQQIPSGNQIP